MSFSKFFKKDHPDRIFSSIDALQDQNITNTCSMSLIPHEFGKEFIIGAEIQNTPDQSNKSRYFYIHFMDDIEHPHVCKRGIKSGILKINELAQMIILDRNVHEITWTFH